MSNFFKNFALGFSVAFASAPLMVLVFMAAVTLTNKEVAVESGRHARTDPAPSPDRGLPQRARNIGEPPIAMAQSLPPEVTLELPDDHYFGPGTMMKDYRVYAVVCTSAPLETDVLTLDEAIETGLCEVRETGEVGELEAIVVGDAPVLALAGDLLLGGRQDRIVGQSVLLMPGQNDVPAFCVEHGRWSAREDEESGRFHKSKVKPQVDLDVKSAAALQASQAGVWMSVEECAREFDAQDERGTGSYRTTFDSRSANDANQLAELGRNLVGEHVVGFAVFCEHELVSVDIFDSTELFNKVADKLLQSYAMTAVRMQYHERGTTEAPVGYPYEDIAENPNDDPSDMESPLASAIGLIENIAGGGGATEDDRIVEDGYSGRGPEQPREARFECRLPGRKRPVHIGIMRR